LRARINLIRSGRGLPAYSWTDPSPTSATTIQAAHILEMRTALSQAYVAAGLTAPAFTDASLANVYVKAAHIIELRAAVIAIE
jgi:hypothetical protein